VISDPMSVMIHTAPNSERWLLHGRVFDTSTERAGFVVYSSPSVRQIALHRPHDGSTSSILCSTRPGYPQGRDPNVDHRAMPPRWTIRPPLRPRSLDQREPDGR
jgi:hypothetical protein